MKLTHKITLIILCLSTVGIAQEIDPRIALIAPVEVEIAKFIEDNLESYKLSQDEINSLTNNEDHHNLSQEQLNLTILSIKKSRLRSLYFEQQPEKKRIYAFEDKAIQNRQICADGGFEGANPLLNYNFFNYNETQPPFDACQMNLQAGTPPQPPNSINDFNADYTIVTQGFDPLLANQATSVNIPRTFNNSLQAIKLNRSSINQAILNGGLDVTHMRRNLNINEDNLSINFSLIMEQPGHLIPQPDGTIKNEQPFFRVRLYDSFGSIFYERCIISDPNDCIFTQTGNTLYSGWQCLNINTESLNGQSSTLEFSIVDCGQGAHYGTVYIDEICNTTCLNSAFGDILLDPVNLDCPTDNFQVCGSFLAPQCATGLPNISLDILDINGIITTLTNPIINITNNQFCFNVNISDFGLNPNGNFEFNVDANFNLNTGIITTISDLSANVGPDVSFGDCSDPCETITDSSVSGSTLSWVSTSTSFELEFEADGACCPNDGGEYNPPVNLTYQINNTNQINLSNVYQDILSVNGSVKCFRYKIKTDCSEWSDWCCLQILSANPFEFENPYKTCFPNSPCEDLEPITLTSPSNDVNATSNNINYIDYENITASNKIEPNYSSQYIASDWIKLTTGFHAKNNSSFLARIQECVDTDIVNSPNGSRFIEGDIKSDDFKMYPNPTEDRITLSIINQKIQSFDLYDIHGRLVKNAKSINTNKHTINLKTFTRGMYILRVTLEDGSTINRNIILK